MEAVVATGDEPERVNRQHYSGNVFGVFGLRPALGRLFGPGDDSTPGGHPIAVIAHDYWQRRFGGNAGVLGTSIRIGRQVYEVVGVGPDGFTGTEPGRPADLFVTVLAAPLIVLAAAACAAALPPALRAVRIDPARTLRAE